MNSKFGILIPQYNSIDYIEDCLKPWLEYKKQNHAFEIVVMDGKFLEFGNDESHNSTDGTLEFLEKYEKEQRITLIKAPRNLQEHDLKNLGLNLLKERKVDYFIIWGVDEIIEFEQIEKVIKYVEKNPFIAFFKINYKNYIFDRKHYVLDFSIQRVYKVNINELVLDAFYWDDDLKYKNNKTGELVDFMRLPSLLIPNLLVKHYSWSDFERSRNKILYQSRHFAHGAGCFVKVNSTNTNIEFNMEHFNKINKTPPDVFEEN